MATATRTVTTTVTSSLEGFNDAYKAVAEKFAAEKDHSTPALAAIVRATRTARGGISQMQLGTNRAKDNSPLVKGVETPASLAEGVKGHLKSGWFSVIANVEQGGRKTAIPEAFVEYIAKLSGVSKEAVANAVAEDAKLRTATESSN